MSERPAIPDEVLARQREASDPSVSAWVSANAGSGKTYVLAQRVIRLLLGGTTPEKILCLTFTKAAAANMAKTVFETLAQWTAFDDAKLDDAIRAMSNEKPDVKRRALARKLFAMALETPGGLKVQTIHAFCTRLLQQFPFEADVAARFTVMDDATQRQLLDQLTLDVLLVASSEPRSPPGQALASAITAASDQSFRDIVGEAIGKRDVVTGWIEQAGGIDAAIAELSTMLGVSPDQTIEDVEAEFFKAALIAESEWQAVAAALAEGMKTDGDRGASFTRLPTLAGEKRLEEYWSIFCTDKLKRRARVATNTIRDNSPALFQRLVSEQDRVCELLDRRRAVLARDRTAALMTIAAAVIDRYQAEKSRRGWLDYDDLIDKSRELLTRVDAAWVHYKLDLGIDHVLVDEAQDTSPKQWDVIERLVDEFAAGAGARSGLNRTIFAVGDEKQSIFSFQGAAPAKFSDMRRYFEKKFEAAKSSLRYIPFRRSFRSLPVILEAVDTVFAREEAFSGLSADPVKTVHEAVRAKAPGHAEIWPLVEPEAREIAEGWDAPFDTASETSPRVRLARKIAACVRQWIGRVRVGDGDRRHPARPGDILVLVRQRGPLFDAIIRALKNAGVPVAGADRLILTEHIAVMDLIALADALLLPDDDLALATVLKSPLFGLDEEQLFALAADRTGSLHSALCMKADADPAFGEAAARFARMAGAARRETPFAFYARVLGPEHGRKRFLARLGREANDAIDEFLSLALDYERLETPSLQGFVAWLRAANAEIKRDMEILRDEVRVMTVHGAKGLEAPIVILADTTTPPAGPYPPRLLALTGDNAPGPIVWAGRKDDDVGPLSDARCAAVQAAECEYRRLLYVALTRAADRLVVCGAVGTKARPQGCWYDLVHAALVPSAHEEDADDGDGKVWRYRKMAADDDAGAEAAPGAASSAAGSARADWLERDAPAEAPSLAPLSPSAAYDEATATRVFSDAARTARKNALMRGSAVHRLLQSLPDIPREARATAARRYLARSLAAFDQGDREHLLDQALAVLDDARFAELFLPGSRAEVSIVGRIVAGGRTVAVSGQVDRLVIAEETILIADYKTNRPAPRRLEDVQPYVTQLALYRAVLASLYPGKPVRAALLWTDVPDLMEVPAEAMERALTGLTSP